MTPTSSPTLLFDELMAEVTAATDQFDHRAHLHLTWLAVRRVGMPAAVGLVSDGIQRTARYAGVPQKYHATISRAWVELVAHHAAAHTTPDFAGFIDRLPLPTSTAAPFVALPRTGPPLTADDLLRAFHLLRC